ncbi:MAG: signal peptidase I [Lachnospiraceae bacterium]|nr:signal peptidase I [Lachnospiraceae bacterium]
MAKVLKILIRTVLQAAMIFAVLYVFVFPVSIRGTSMQSTLYDGDRVVASRFLGRLGLYKAGDIIIFSERVNDENRNMVKRVIAVEDDKVVIRSGKVFVNDKPVNDEYISGYTKGNLSITVPKGCIFVMGDNREASFDSRQYGSVEKRNVHAKVIARVYPFDRFKLY